MQQMKRSHLLLCHRCLISMLVFGVWLLRILYCHSKLWQTVNTSSAPASASALALGSFYDTEILVQPDVVTSSAMKDMIHEKTNNDDSIAGCLLIMDDNYRLAEWIAYHYHVINLRYLVVAVDPRSNTSPEPILDLFRKHLNMTITTWTDLDSWQDPPKDPNSGKEMRQRYLDRQKDFLQRCMHHVYLHNQSWTMLWDTDEFIVYTDYNRVRTNTKSPLRPSVTSPPDLKEPGTILRYLKAYDFGPCIPLNRVWVGANETELDIVSQEHHIVHPYQLDTLRYRYRNDHDLKMNGKWKSILNVQYVNHSLPVKSPHRPAPDQCHVSLYGPTAGMPFYLNHYISSWEAYSYRNDSRKGLERSMEGWRARAYSTSKHYEPVTTTWLRGFVETVGTTTALRLLEHAGLPLSYNASHKMQEFKCIRCKIF